MENLLNQNQLQNINKELTKYQEKITQIQTEITNYLQFINEKEFNFTETNDIDQSIKNAETTLDKLIEVKDRLNKIDKTTNELSEISKVLTKQCNELNTLCGEREFHYGQITNDMIDKIIELKQKKMKVDIQPHQQKIDEIKNAFEKEKNEIEKRRVEIKNVQAIKEMLTNEEKQQLEKWTNKKCKEVVFDTNVDNWDKETSVFHEKVLNKQNLLYVIEDTNKNKFGAFSPLALTKYSSWTQDPNCFIFSLKSNGRYNGMIKCEKTTTDKYAMYLYDKSNNYLFGVGSGHQIAFYKQSVKSNSYCQQNYSGNTHYFDYHGHEKLLCGTYYPQYYTPQRLIVIQMN